MVMFHFDHEYPLSPKEVLSPRTRFKADTLAAMQKFKAAKPWRGSQVERIEKFRVLIKDLSIVYGIPAPYLDGTGVDADECSDGSYYMPMTHCIYIHGRLSVVTTLHEYAHALGKNEFDACRWSLNLFKRVFPRQWKRLEFDGHMARRRGEAG